MLLDERVPLVELLPKPVVELAPVPATEPHGWLLRPVGPDIEGVLVPVRVLPLDVPGVAEGLVWLPLAPALEPELPPPPPPPPPDWANATPVPTTSIIAASVGTIPFRMVDSFLRPIFPT